MKLGKPIEASLPTGVFIPVTINGKPVFDISDPNQPKAATFEPGRRYTAHENGDIWVVTAVNPSK